MRIQQAANAYKELDNRRSVRVNKHSKHSGGAFIFFRFSQMVFSCHLAVLFSFKQQIVYTDSNLSPSMLLRFGTVTAKAEFVTHN